jgi:hypothetical protein
MRKILNSIHIIVSALILIGCAKTGELTGGKRDETPPVLLKSIPVDKTTEFNGKEIRLVFNEYVALKSPELNIRLFPGSLSEITFVAEKNEILINKLSLKSNTTYSLTVQEGVTDITEKNKTEPFSLLFSTGKNLDTAEINGVILSNLLEGHKNIRVLIVNRGDSLNKKTIVAEGISNSDGEFKIASLKKGDYDVYFLEDLNNDLIHDMPKEAVGLKQSIYIETDTSKVNLSVLSFRPDERPLKLLSISNRKYRLEATFNKSISKVFIERGYKTEIVENTYNKLFIYPAISDSVQQSFTLKTLDSTYFTLDTTLLLEYKMESIPAPKCQKISIDPILNNNIEIKQVFDLPLFNYPYTLEVLLDGHQDTSIKQIVEGRNLYIHIPAKLIRVDTSNVRLRLDIDSLHILDTNITVLKNIEDSYGHINLKKTDSLNVYFLVSKTGNVIYMKYNNDILTSGPQSPNDYTLYAIQDSDADGQLTIGSLSKNRNPEIIYKHKDAIKLKANWTVDIERFKPQKLYITR